MTEATVARSLVFFMFLVSMAMAFVPQRCSPAFVSFPTTTSASKLNDSQSKVETLEFKIYPDGRVEEVVRGVKGGDCHKITEKINKALGQVVASEPTEEMFEQKLEVDETLVEKVGESSSWDGKDSW